MKKFRSILVKVGEQRDGVGITEEMLKGCVNADVSVKDPDGKVIEGATAKAYFDPEYNALLADIELPDEVDPMKANMELMILAKLVQDKKDQATAIGDEIIKDHDNKVNNIDDSVEPKIIEVWYDLRNWMRYVKTQTVEERAQSQVGGDGIKFIYGGMSCVEEGTIGFLTEEIYENGKRAAKAARAFARVKHPLTRPALQAENALMLLMQQVYDSEPHMKGNRVLQPVKFKDEFIEVSE